MTSTASESPTMSFAVTEKPVRTVVVPDRFLSKLRAVLEATILHPFTMTVIRVVGSHDQSSP